MDHVAERRQVVARPDLRRQLQQAHEHGRHHLGDAHAIALNGGQEGLRLELAHQDGHAPQPLHAEAPDQRGGVVERRGGKIDGVLGQAPARGQTVRERVGSLDRTAGERQAQPLGPPGGAGGVGHVGSCDLVPDRLGRHRRSRRLPGRRIADRAVHPVDVAEVRHAHASGEAVGPRQAGGHEQQRRAAVVHDVGGLPRREPGRDRHDVEPATLPGPEDGEVFRGVRHVERDGVAGLQPERAKELRALVRPGLELRVARRRAGVGEDHSWMVGLRSGEAPGMHRSAPPSLQVRRRMMLLPVRARRRNAAAYPGGSPERCRRRQGLPAGAARVCMRGAMSGRTTWISD